MNRSHLLAVVCALAAILAGCGGPEESLAPPTTPPPDGGDAGPVQVGPLVVRPASAAGFVAEPISGDGNVSLVALYGSRVTYLASQALLDRIVFARGSGTDYDICVCNLDGSGAVRLIDNAASDTSPAWSPDGTRIAFERTRVCMDSEIVVMNADGSGAHALTDNTASDRSPAWSPEGRRIVFQTDRTGDNEIYVMYDDGTGAINLSNNPAEDRMPDWSHYQYNSKIAFASNRDAGDWEIYTMREDGSSQTRVTNRAGIDQSPAFSLISSALAWESMVQGAYEIMVSSGGSSSGYNFSSAPGAQNFPTWSSDGRFICYSEMLGCSDYELVLQQTDPPYDRFVLTDNSSNDRCPDLGSPTLQTDRVIIGPAGSDWGGRNPIWTYADAGVVAYADDGYRNFVRIAVRPADLPGLSIESLSQHSAMMMGPGDLAAVLVEANEIVSLREDAGRGRQAALWQLDPLDATAVVLYFSIWTGKLVAVMTIADEVYPSSTGSNGSPVIQRIEGDATMVEGNFSAVFGGSGERLAGAASAVRITADDVIVVR